MLLLQVLLHLNQHSDFRKKEGTKDSRKKEGTKIVLKKEKEKEALNFLICSLCSSFFCFYFFYFDFVIHSSPRCVRGGICCTTVSMVFISFHFLV